MRNVNLRVVNEILKAIQEAGGQKNLYQLFTKNPRRPGSKSTVLKYLHMFVEHDLLIKTNGKKHGEKIYSLSEKGKEALEYASILLGMLETK